MQLTIPLLLALPVAFAVSYVIAFPLTHKLITYKWALAANDVRVIAAVLELRSEALADCDDPVESVNQWLSGSTNLGDPVAMAMRSLPETDPWGNRYHATSIPSDGESALPRIGIYCLGRDGTSSSSGCDEDDISSWSDDPVRFYQRRAMNDQIEDRITATACDAVRVLADVAIVAPPLTPTVGGLDGPMTNITPV